SVKQQTPQEILDERLKELGLKKAEENEKIAIEKRRQALSADLAAEASAKAAASMKAEPVDTDSTLKAIEDLDTLSDSYISTAIDAKIRLEVEKEDPAIPQEHWKEEKEPLDEETELSFSDWLKKTKALKKKQEEELKESKETQDVKKSTETDLIERFIKEEPRIAKPKKEFYNPVNMARQSVIEDPEFVTETLANIYASQGNTAKAIMAYHTLSLKYPEKKLYFASLIEKLEKGEA
ncbi:MAG: hypothetical protein ACHQRM_17895, partial [Bacteroidia bacterium]